MIVTEAGVDPKVCALVYVAARAPDAGEDYTALAKQFPTPPAAAGIVFDGDEGRLTEAAFLRDYAVQPPFHKALLSGKTQHAAWRLKPRFYAVSTQDRTINPDLQHFMAKRMGATTIEVNSRRVAHLAPAGNRRSDRASRRPPVARRARSCHRGRRGLGFGNIPPGSSSISRSTSSRNNASGISSCPVRQA